MEEGTALEKVKSFFRKKTGVEVPQQEIADKMHRDHLEARNELIDQERRLSFSYSLEASLTEEEKRVDHIIKRLKGQIKNDNYNTIIHDFYDHLVTLYLSDNHSQNSKIVSCTKCFATCPKVVSTTYTWPEESPKICYSNSPMIPLFTIAQERNSSRYPEYYLSCNNFFRTKN